VNIHEDFEMPVRNSNGIQIMWFLERKPLSVRFFKNKHKLSSLSCIRSLKVNNEFRVRKNKDSALKCSAHDVCSVTSKWRWGWRHLTSWCYWHWWLLSAQLTSTAHISGFSLQTTWRLTNRPWVVGLLILHNRFFVTKLDNSGLRRWIFDSHSPPISV